MRCVAHVSCMSVPHHPIHVPCPSFQRVSGPDGRFGFVSSASTRCLGGDGVSSAQRAPASSAEPSTYSRAYSSRSWRMTFCVLLVCSERPVYELARARGIWRECVPREPQGSRRSRSVIRSRTAVDGRGACSVRGKRCIERCWDCDTYQQRRDLVENVNDLSSRFALDVLRRGWGCCRHLELCLWVLLCCC